MMKKSILLILATSLSATSAAPLFAATMYASDQLTVPMRTGTSTNHKIIRFIPSGEKLEVVETNSAEGYARVVTTGVEGWVNLADLMQEPGGYEQLGNITQKLNTEREKINQLQDTIKQLKSERLQLQEELDSEQQKNHQLIKKNDFLGNEGLKEWFVIGALVSIGSLFLGLIIPRIQWRKKDTWSNNF